LKFYDFKFYQNYFLIIIRRKGELDIHFGKIFFTTFLRKIWMDYTHNFNINFFLIFYKHNQSPRYFNIGNNFFKENGSLRKRNFRRMPPKT